MTERKRLQVKIRLIQIGWYLTVIPIRVFQVVYLVVVGIPSAVLIGLFLAGVRIFGGIHEVEDQWERNFARTWRLIEQAMKWGKPWGSGRTGRSG